MDYFNIDALDMKIKKYKETILSKIKSSSITEKNMQYSSDLLCQVLDYSPSIQIGVKSKLYKKFQLKNTTPSPEKVKNLNSNVSLNFEKNDHLVNTRKVKAKRGPISKANHMSEKETIRIYLLNTFESIDIELESKDTFRDLKNKIISKIKKENHIQLKSSLAEGYEIRLIDEDDTIPNMDIAPFDDNMNVLHSKINTFAFVEKENFHYSNSPNQEVIIINNSKEEVELRVYYKIGNYKNFTKTFILKFSDILRDLLDKILNESALPNKNPDLYYFQEHSEQKEDMDNALNLELNVRYLPTYKLDFRLKKFPDVPKSINYSQILGNEMVSNFEVEKNKEKEEGNGQECVYNAMTAGIYQEFKVVKISKNKANQERILGIDSFNLHNNLPAQKNGLAIHKIKHPLKKIKEITHCEIIDDKLFCIVIKDKQTVYKVKNNNIRDEIVAKIQFLINN